MRKPDIFDYPQGHLARFKADVIKYEKYLQSKRKNKSNKRNTNKINWLKYGLVSF